MSKGNLQGQLANLLLDFAAHGPLALFGSCCRRCCNWRARQHGTERNRRQSVKMLNLCNRKRISIDISTIEVKYLETVLRWPRLREGSIVILRRWARSAGSTSDIVMPQKLVLIFKRVLKRAYISCRGQWKCLQETYGLAKSLEDYLVYLLIPCLCICLRFLTTLSRNTTKVSYGGSRLTVIVSFVFLYKSTTSGSSVRGTAKCIVLKN